MFLKERRLQDRLPCWLFNIESVISDAINSLTILIPMIGITWINWSGLAAIGQQRPQRYSAIPKAVFNLKISLAQRLVSKDFLRS